MQYGLYDQISRPLFMPSLWNVSFAAVAVVQEIFRWEWLYYAGIIAGVLFLISLCDELNDRFKRIPFGETHIFLTRVNYWELLLIFLGMYRAHASPHNRESGPARPLRWESTLRRHHANGTLVPERIHESLQRIEWIW